MRICDRLAIVAASLPQEEVMSAQFGLYLGEDRIPVINWINRHGSPVGRELRFTLPTEAKAKVESHLDATFRLERGGESWDFEVLSVTQHGTGTNGVPALGRVRVAPAKPTLPKPPRPTEQPAEPVAEVAEPAAAGVADSDEFKAAPQGGDGGFSRGEKSSLRELLLQKKAERQAMRAADEEE